jgi:hypothetical protein
LVLALLLLHPLLPLLVVARRAVAGLWWARLP